MNKQLTPNKKYTVTTLVIFFSVTALTTLAFDCLLTRIAEMRLSSLPASVFLIKGEPYWGLWFGPALWLGILSAYPVSEVLSRLIFGKSYYLKMEKASEKNSGIDAQKLTIFIYCISLLILISLMPLLMDWYARFEKNQLALNPFLGFGEIKYHYGDITHLVCTSHLKTPLGKIVKRIRHFIIFQDGRQWCAESYLSSPQRVGDTNQKLMDFLSNKTGKAIEQVKLIEDL